MIKILGVPLRLHPLFLMIMVLSVATGYFIELLTLFCIVIVHELGHIGAAKWVGWRVNEIRLLPFGGVAEVDHSGQVSPWQEIFVALAGPLQNIWMIAVSLLLEGMGIWDATWSSYFIQANIWIAAFNLLPILPLDGGKIVHALFSMLVPYYHALLYGSKYSIVFSFVLMIYSVFPLSGGIDLNLLVVGTFLLYVNWFEYRHISYRYFRFLMSRGDPDDSKPDEPIIIKENSSLQKAVRMLKRGKHHWIYIVKSNGSVRTMLPERELIKLYFKQAGRN